MRNMAVLTALFAFALAFALASRTASAADVTPIEAEKAATAWAGETGSIDGAEAVSSEKHFTTNGAVFYSVRTVGGGTVFVSGDDRMDPVVAFSSSAISREEVEDRDGPLWALLNRDQSERKKALDGGLIGARAAAPANRAKWAALVTRGEAIGRLRLVRRFTLLGAAPSYQYASQISDLRVDSFVESRWSQEYPWNYYTPKDGSGVVRPGDRANAVCGCVATAMSQIMFTHKYPEKATVPSAAAADPPWFGSTKLTTDDFKVSGEAYAWDKMKAVPDDTDDEGCEAVGRLTGDAGRAVGMMYTSGSSGSFNFKAALVLRTVFNYGSSEYASKGSVGSLTGNATTMGKTFYANLDAGYPVLLGISGSPGGHAVVADGYGFHSGAAYVHVNMGWGGSKDLWYNMPPIAEFDVIDDVSYNIIPDGAGKGILAGRTIDDDGKVLAGAVVTVYETGTENVVTQITSSALGVWAAVLPSGTYDLAFIDANNELVADLEKIGVSAPLREDEYNFYIKNPDGKVVPFPASRIPTQNSLGNSWGNDVTLMFPRVRIVTGVETNVYSTLDKALKGASAIAAAGGYPVMEILTNVPLRVSAKIDYACELREATGEVSGRIVTRQDGVSLTVAEGGSLVASNCEFVAVSSGTVPIVVEKNGKVYVGPGFAADRVATEAADCFNVIGRVDNPFIVECAAAKAADAVFGHAETDDDAALTGSISLIGAHFDPTGETRAAAESDGAGGYNLVWKSGTPIPVAAAAGYYVTSGDATNTAISAQRLFDKFFAAVSAGGFDATPEAVLLGRGDVSLSGDLAFSFAARISGENGATLEPAETSHILVKSGGDLRIEGVAIVAGEGRDGADGRNGADTYAVVESGGALTLGDGAALDGFVTGANTNSSYFAAGTVAVLSGGAMRLESGSEIRNCEANGAKSCGGGVWVAAGGLLDLAGGKVVDCRAKYEGGGVYTDNKQSDTPQVVVSGPSFVEGNLNGKTNDSNVYIGWNSTNVPKIAVTNSAAGGSIGVKYATSANNATGAVFAVAMTAAMASASESAFFSDSDSTRKVRAVGTSLVWRALEAMDVVPQPIDESDTEAVAGATAEMTLSDGSVNHWTRLQDAIAWLSATNAASATITMAKDDWFDTNLVVGCDLKILPAAGAAPSLDRDGDWSITVSSNASLTIGAIVLTQTNMSYEAMLYGMALATNPPNAAASAYISAASANLTLDGTTIVGGVSTGRYAQAVYVTDGSTFTMKNGATISDCYSFYDVPYDFKEFSETYVKGSGYYDEDTGEELMDTNTFEWGEYRWLTKSDGSLDSRAKDGTSYSAGLLVRGSTANLEGGAITNCAALRVGGAFFDNDSTVYISGDFSIGGNAADFTIDYSALLPGGTYGNASASANSTLLLAGELAGSDGIKRDVKSDLVIFGAVTNMTDDAKIVASAKKFVSDDDGSTGVVLKKVSTGAKCLAWSSRLASDGSYTDADGETYTLVGSSAEPYSIAPPTGASLVYNGESQIGVEGAFGYVLSGVTNATAAGTYTATASLVDAGTCAWSDGTTDDLEIVWTIAKAEYDMSGVAFLDAEYEFDGNPHSIYVTGELPDGVSVVSYENNGASMPGEYVVTATLSGDTANYEALDTMTATMTIVAVSDYPSTTNLVYTGEEQTGIDYNPTAYAIDGVYAATDAGTYTATVTPTKYGKWSDGSTNAIEVTWTIDQAPLTVTADTQWKNVGEADPGLTWTAEGFVNGETAETAVTGSLVRAEGEAVGYYWIYQGTLGAKNYAIDYHHATLNIKAGSGSGGDSPIDDMDDPSFEIVAFAIEDPADASMRVSVQILDGADAQAVDTNVVKSLFQMSTNLVDWAAEGLEIDYVSGDGTGPYEYIVKPEDETLPQAFIRMKHEKK